MNIYDFNVKDNHGKEVSLKEYEGKLLVIVNTATKCGLTPQYEAIESLYKECKDKGLEVLDFPCNQFMHQAPGTAEEIDTFCSLNYQTTFPRFEKVDVNGENAHPLFKWLKEQAPEDKSDKKAKSFEKKVKLLTLKNKASDIKWNFGKFVIDRQGNVIARYSPAYDLEAMKQEIKDLL
ncbi:MAG: glutathione peroxidase [Coprobacillaceae bacterium]